MTVVMTTTSAMAILMVVVIMSTGLCSDGDGVACDMMVFAAIVVVGVMKMGAVAVTMMGVVKVVMGVLVTIASEVIDSRCSGDYDKCNGDDDYNDDVMMAVSEIAVTIIQCIHQNLILISY